MKFRVITYCVLHLVHTELQQLLLVGSCAHPIQRVYKPWVMLHYRGIPYCPVRWGGQCRFQIDPYLWLWWLPWNYNKDSHVTWSNHYFIFTADWLFISTFRVFFSYNMSGRVLDLHQNFVSKFYFDKWLRGLRSILVRLNLNTLDPNFWNKCIKFITGTNFSR